jgi:hypothetical protein
LAREVSFYFTGLLHRAAFHLFHGHPPIQTPSNPGSFSARNFEVFHATAFLAAITQYIPDKGAQMVRYYGWYSKKMRGQRGAAGGG